MRMREVLLFVLSIVCSSLASIALMRRYTIMKNGVLRVTKLEIVDTHGQVQASFGIRHDGTSASHPELVLLDPQGQESVSLKVRTDGEGYLVFNERQTEGTVVLGNLSNEEENSRSPNDGAWGLIVRSKAGPATSIGFLESGQPAGISRNCK